METFLIVSHFSRTVNRNPLRATLKLKRSHIVSIPNTANHDLTTLRINRIILLPDVLKQKQVAVQVDVEDYLTSHDQYEGFFHLTVVSLEYVPSDENRLVYQVTLNHALTGQVLGPPFQIEVPKSSLKKALNALDRGTEDSWKQSFDLATNRECIPDWSLPPTETVKAMLAPQMKEYLQLKLKWLDSVALQQTQWFEQEASENRFLQCVLSVDQKAVVATAKLAATRILVKKLTRVQVILDTVVYPWLKSSKTEASAEIKQLAAYVECLQLLVDLPELLSSLAQHTKTILSDKLLQTVAKSLGCCLETVKVWLEQDAAIVEQTDPSYAFLNAHMEHPMVDRRSKAFRRLEVFKRAVFHELLKQKFATNNLPSLQDSTNMFFETKTEAERGNLEFRLRFGDKLFDLLVDEYMVRQFETQSLVKLSTGKLLGYQASFEWFRSNKTWVGTRMSRDYSDLRKCTCSLEGVDLSPDTATTPYNKIVSVATVNTKSWQAVESPVFAFTSRFLVAVFHQSDGVGVCFNRLTAKHTIEDTVSFTISASEYNTVREEQIKAHVQRDARCLFLAILSPKTMWSDFEHLKLVCREIDSPLVALRPVAFRQIRADIPRSLPSKSFASSQMSSSTSKVQNMPYFLEKRGLLYIVQFCSPTEYLMYVFCRREFMPVRASANTGKNISGLRRLHTGVLPATEGNRQRAADYLLGADGAGAFGVRRFFVYRMSVF